MKLIKIQGLKGLCIFKLGYGIMYLSVKPYQIIVIKADAVVPIHKLVAHFCKGHLNIKSRTKALTLVAYGTPVGHYQPIKAIFLP